MLCFSTDYERNLQNSAGLCCNQNFVNATWWVGLVAGIISITDYRVLAEYPVGRPCIWLDLCNSV